MKKKFETLAIESRLSTSAFREQSPPIYMTSSYSFENAEARAALFSGDQEGYMYSRVSNPNTDDFATKLAVLEGAENGIATASGMSAIFAVFAALLKSGDHILASKSIFGSSRHVIEHILPQWNIGHTWVDIHDTKAWTEAFKMNPQLVFVETPSNPSLDLIDIDWLAQLCHENNALLVVDNTFATPYLQQPILLGADLVVHSATKYIDGQGRVLGGAICGSQKQLEKCLEFVRKTGPSQSPFNGWVLSKSLETLAVRMDRHCSNALQLATHLKSHKEIEKVAYPHLPNSSDYELARRQMRQGGGLVGCFVKGGLSRGRAFLNALQLHSLTANLGDTRSIATHPASTTHSKLDTKQQLEIGITPGFLRFSVGLEHIDDIIADIDQALFKTKS